MYYKKLGEDIYIPKRSDSALQNSEEIKFNYYLNSRVNSHSIDLDITSKLFDDNKTYIRKSCYRVKLGEIENCVKANIIDHMESLGLPKEKIPESLYDKAATNQPIRLQKARAYSD